MSGPNVPVRPRILLVEDNRNQADALALLLGSGFEIVRAADGREARARLATDDSFDVILSDVRMPRMSGFALLEWAREQRPVLERRFIFLTSEPSASVAQTLAQTHPLLRKPAKPEELRAAIEAVLAKR
jgi:CheY-like chemotaxis protein